ncbi:MULTISPECIES: MFS transporter [unclassified Rhizobium]|uniref:MFS transporter n=1 Tax=unclassified Rhizobium TaxID=2613769 RepID=UPI002168218E|nr:MULTISPECIES: MFS transporter [unclassified Rhizobium]MCS4093661.1 putative MFS family arabinose efflux permease [Rhizobium sp. BK176]
MTSDHLQGLLVAVMIACVGTCYGFGLSLFPQIIPDMRRSLAFDYAFVGTVTGLIQLASVASALISTWLVHRIGAARTVVGSVGLCGLSLSTVPLAENVYVLAGLLMIAGSTGASTFVPMIDLASRVVSIRRRGLAMSLISSAPSYGVLGNSALVAAFAGSDRWQIVWYITGAISVLLTITTSILFKRAGLSSLAQGPQADGFAERRPSLRAMVPWVFLVFVLGFINGVMPFPYLTYLSPLLREERGYTVGTVSLLWATIGTVGIAAGFVLGSIASRFGSRLAMLVCYLCFVLAGLLMHIQAPLELSVISVVSFSLGFYPIYGLLPAYVSHRAGPRIAVTVMGICTVLQGLGGASGNIFGGLIKTSTQSFEGIYLAVALIAAVAAGMTMLLTSDQKQRLELPNSRP